MMLEVLASTKNFSTPSCHDDPIACIFIVIHNESAQIQQGDSYNKVAILLINRRESMNIPKPPLGIRNNVHQTLVAKDEFELYSKLISIFQVHDPDILVGWETEVMSIGYICKRAEHALGFKLTDLISRNS